MIAVHGAIASGSEDIEIPNLDDEREAWDEWLMSEPKLPKTREQNDVYAALFPENPRGLTPREMQRQTNLNTLRGMGMAEEVSESG
jgi:hypothetical protein